MAGRAGLVGTQNIRNNASRIGGLDRVVQDSTLIEAVDNQRGAARPTSTSPSLTG